MSILIAGVSSLGILQPATGQCHIDTGTKADSIARIKDAVESSKSEEMQDSQVAVKLNNLASALTDQGDYTRAEAIFKRSLIIAEQSFGADHPNVAAIQNNLGHLYVLQHRNADAEALLRRSLGTRERVLGRDHADVAASLKNLGEMYRIQYRYMEAEALYRRALSILEHESVPDDLDILALLTAVGELQSALGYYSSAASLFDRSISLAFGVCGPDSLELARNYEGLAAIRAAESKTREAESLYLRALRIREQNSPKPRTVIILLRLATVYVGAKRFDAAGSAIELALSAYERLGLEQAGEVTVAFEQYVELIKTKNRSAAAVIEARIRRH